MIKKYGKNVVNFDQLVCAKPVEINSGERAVDVHFLSGQFVRLIGEDMDAFLKDAENYSVLVK